MLYEKGKIEFVLVSVFSCIQLSKIFQLHVPDRQRSENLAKYALTLNEPMVGLIPSAAEFKEAANEILLSWQNAQLR
jgi:hypothetical protein